MKKNIDIPITKNVHLAVIQEWNSEFLEKNWNVYIINNRDTAIELVIVVSKGYDRDRKTSTIRQGLGDIPAKAYKKIELLQDDLIEFNNEFFVTFFADDTLYEKRYLFKKNSINESNLVALPVMGLEGVLIK